MVIAANEQETARFKIVLDGAGFSDAGDIFSLLERVASANKTYLVLSQTNFKLAYDFVAQYPTGQIEIFNPQTMKSEIAAPNYQNSAVVFLITKENLSAMQNSGLKILGKVGLTYQS